MGAFAFDPDELFELDLDPSLFAAVEGDGDSDSDDGSEDIGFRAFAADPRPCSNDSPEWAERTVPCPNARGVITTPPAVTSSDVPLDLSNLGTATPTSSSPDDIAQSEFSSSKLVTSNDAGLIRDPQASNDTGLMDGLLVATSSAASSADDEEEEYPSFYSCSVSSREELAREGGGDDGELPLRFDYEIYTATGADDVAAVLSAFERQLTNGVASSLGLVDCPSAEVGAMAVEVALRKVPMGGRRTLRKGRVSGARDRRLEGSGILGMSGDPADELDTDTASCTSSATLDAPSKCSPVIGAMTVWMTEAQRRHLRQLADADSQEEMLLNAIETYIGENEESYLNDDLLYVAYVGQRDLERGAGLIVADPITDGSMVPVESGGSGPNPVLVGLATTGALLALLIVGAAAWVSRRRRRREANGGLDPESGAFPGLTPESNAVSENFGAQMQASDEPMHEGESNGPGTSAPGDELPIRTAPSSLAVLGGASTLVRNLVPQPGDSPSGTDSVVRQLSYSQHEKGGDVVEPPLDSTLNTTLDSAPDSAPVSELFLGNQPTIVDAEDNYAFKVVEDNADAIEEPEPSDNPMLV